MGGGKQLSCARIEGQTGNGNDRQTRRRDCPRVGSASACKPKYTKVRRGVQVTANVVVSDAVDWLVTDRRSCAFQVHPSRTPGAAVGGRIVRHGEDMTRSGGRDRRVTEVRDVRMIRVRRID